MSGVFFSSRDESQKLFFIMLSGIDDVPSIINISGVACCAENELRDVIDFRTSLKTSERSDTFGVR